MIYVRMKGRLGNQLFQYAFVRVLQKNNPEQEVIYDFSKVYHDGKKEDGFDNSLKFFRVRDVVEDKWKLNLSLLQRVCRKMYFHRMPKQCSFEEKNAYQRKLLKLLSHFGLYYLDLGYYKFPLKLRTRTSFIDGYFESSKYFDSIREELIEELVPVSPPLEKNRFLYEKMQTTNSVCISIRRGDFISDPNNRRIYDVCTKAYFERAIKRIKEMQPDVTLFFFSDDIAWVKSNLDYGIESYYEDGTDPVWEKLRLMYSCKHFILSNSTFSWWAQYLSRFPDKIVIAPNRWYNNSYHPDIYEDSWILIDPD